jgi:four helix bundle protein
VGESAKPRTSVKTDEKKNDKPNGRVAETAKKAIRHFRDLDVYQNAFETALRVYELSKKYPDGERYALTDQIRRSSRSVCANIAEAWRNTAAFISKLSDSESEAAETQVHLEFAVRHGYIANAEFEALDDAYEHILGQLVRMIDHPEKWVIGARMNTSTQKIRPFACSPFLPFLQI